jgi:hypothetical protein
LLVFDFGISFVLHAFVLALFLTCNQCFTGTVEGEIEAGFVAGEAVDCGALDDIGERAEEGGADGFGMRGETLALAGDFEVEDGGFVGAEAVLAAGGGRHGFDVAVFGVADGLEGGDVGSELTIVFGAGGGVEQGRGGGGAMFECVAGRASLSRFGFAARGEAAVSSRGGAFAG